MPVTKPPPSSKETSTGWSSDYYKLPPNAKELQDLIEARSMNFALGNIFKACWRMGLKEGTDRTYDLRKIIWYAQRELTRIEGQGHTDQPKPPTEEDSL